MSKSSKTNKKKLFHRITFKLVFPLALLALLLSGLLLNVKISSLQKYQKLESISIIQSIYGALEKELQSGKTNLTQEDIYKRTPFPSDFFKGKSLSLYNLYDQTEIIPSKRGWNKRDMAASEKSLHLKNSENRNFHIVINKEKKVLNAYMPFIFGNQNKIYIAKFAYPLGQMEDALKDSMMLLVFVLVFVILTGLFIGKGLSKIIIKPILALHSGTQKIIQGKLGIKISIKTGDELEDLANAFNRMSVSLEGMKSDAEDANPLSQLPGNNAIKANIEHRIRDRQKFVIFHSDLDRFKVFNDKFGLSKGDEAITRTSNLLKDVVQKSGKKDDFIGHQGGDDFMIIARADHAEELAKIIIKRFDDEVVRALYSKEDFERGYIVALDRREMTEKGTDVAEEKRFPLLGLSLAGISNRKKDFASYDDSLERAIPVKKKVKDVIESSYEIVE